MVKPFEYKGRVYPDYIKHGNAVEHIAPVASKFCQGVGLDIGGTREWHLPGATPINKEFDDEYSAHNLPEGEYDYIFSSHCLEHIEGYLGTLEYWRKHIRKGGVLFLYLPHPDMEYWRPENCEKHLHEFYPCPMQDTLTRMGFRNVMYSGRDMYWSFSVVGWKI